MTHGSQFATRYSLLVLSFLGAFLIGVSAPRAQVAYNFATAPDQITISTAPVALPMDCLAANGYGQWTSSGSSNGITHLLTNKLTSSSADEPQAGVLSDNALAFTSPDVYPGSDAIKCAANLKGNVRYVCINNARTGFIVEGFDPAPTPGGSGIDISFVGLPGTNSIVNSMALTAKEYPSLETLNVAPASAEPSGTADIFDVAIDASYLYIVWEQSTTTPYSIWAMAIKLSTGAMTLSPIQVTPFTGGGRRPTIAVDIRNSGFVGKFDVVCLSQDLGSTSANDSSNVWWTEYNGSSFSSPVVVATSYTDPLHGPTNWIAPLHARMVVASEAGVSPNTSNQRGIYIIAQNKVFSAGVYMKHLFLDYIFDGNVPPSGTITCDYCDGSSNTVRPGECPVEAGSAYPVKDNPMWVFANPYEGANATSSTVEFTEFHCLYQLDRTGGSNTPSNNHPLMIIRAHDVAHGYCVNGSSSMTFYADPLPSGNCYDGYCGAVNQMGIHVHWIGSDGTHYYRRDLRKFDQNIEENTLLTDECDFKNISGGVTLLASKFLTLYGDPGVDFYTGCGWMNFDNNAALNIGSSTDLGADFIEVAQGSGVGQWGGPSVNWYINFAAGNQMDYYGYFDNYGNGQFTLTGSGESLVSTNVGNYATFPGSSEPVVWNLYNSPLVLISDDATQVPVGMTATDAVFNFINNDMYDPGVISILHTYGNASFTNCQFLIGTGSLYSGSSVLVHGYGTWNGSTGTGDGNYDASPYYSADNHTVTFTSCFYTVGLELEGNDPIAPAAVTINKGLFNFWGLQAGIWEVSPWWPVSITDAAFDQIEGQGININLGTEPSSIGSINQLYSVYIDGNDFLTYYGTIGVYDDELSSGIEIENAPDLISGSSPSDYEDDLRQDITVTSNIFEGTGSESAGSIDAAIHFQNATGDIGYNTIGTVVDEVGAQKYERGIWNESSQASTKNVTWTFICSNTIFGLTASGAAGILTDYWTGYEKLNGVSGCTYGHESSGKLDKGHIDFSSFVADQNAYYGIGGSRTDMTGVHHASNPPPDNPAIVTMTAGSESPILLDQSNYPTNPYSLAYLGNMPTTWTTTYGENTIEGPTGVNDLSSVPTSVTGVPIGDVSNNFWGTGVTCTADATISFSDGSPGDYPTEVVPTGYVCSSGLIMQKGGGSFAHLLDINSDSTADSSICHDLFVRGYLLESNNIEPDAYDTLKLFMEQCPIEADRATNWDGFGDIAGAVSGWSAGGVGRWNDFLTWLKQVLYLNTDTTWYCSDVDDMITALQYNEGAVEAAVRYVIQSGKCPGFDSELFISAQNAQHHSWLDSIVLLHPIGSLYYNDSIRADTLAHPFDTTVPSLQQVGLQILLGPQYAVVGTPVTNTTQALLSAQLMENPTSMDEIGVSFQMGREALVTMQLRDILGRLIPITNAQYNLQSIGTHEATIPVPNLPAGTYYLRLSTDAGDAITLKVVKE